MPDPRPDDLLERPRTRLLLFTAPQVGFLAGFFMPGVRLPLWVASLGVLGVACLVNARRCGRLHCWLTGPLYLLAALAVLLHGAGMLLPGARGWLWLGLGIVVVGNVLTFAPEHLRPRYRG